MSKKKSKTCDGCGGVVTAPSRKVSLEQSYENHLASCHRSNRINKEQAQP